MNRETNLVGLDGKKLSTKKKERRFPIIYNIQCNKEGWLEDDFTKNGWGGCDQVIVFAIIRGRNGRRSDAILSIDGLNNGEQLSAIDQVKSWAKMAEVLKNNNDLGMSFKQIAKDALKSVKKIFELRKQKGMRGK